MDHLFIVYSDGIITDNKWINQPDGKGCPFTLEGLSII